MSQNPIIKAKEKGVSITATGITYPEGTSLFVLKAPNSEDLAGAELLLQFRGEQVLYQLRFAEEPYLDPRVVTAPTSLSN